MTQSPYQKSTTPVFSSAVNTTDANPGEPPKKPATIEYQGQYALEHFKYVADQRLKTFNYYAIVVAAALSGSIAAFDRCPWQLVVAMGVIQLVMAWIFFMIDIRNSRLVFAARRALRHYETCHLPPELAVIKTDDEATKGGHSQGAPPLDKEWTERHWLRAFVNHHLCGPGGASFTMAFNVGFALQVACGIGLMAAAYWLKGPGAGQ